jgi:hypothetical protein
VSPVKLDPLVSQVQQGLKVNEVKLVRKAYKVSQVSDFRR